LIDVAIQLCIEQGYDNTTVEQIAAGAQIAPRTFSRYFSSKDAVIVAIIGEVADDVAACFAHQPADITQYEALARAHLETFRSAQYGRRDSAAFERMRLLLTIVNTAPAIGLGPFMFRADGLHDAAIKVAARRMNVSTHDPAIRILFDTWAVVMGVACQGLGAEGGLPIEPDILCDRIESVYGVFTRLWLP
jgi:AcrR family transcriptional regulator